MSCLLLWSCKTAVVDPVDAADRPEDIGGPATVDDASVNAFGNPSPVLSAGERSLFVLGNSFFRTNWIMAPATTTSRDGLGPHFLAASCSGCHLLDGRGQPPRTAEEIPTALLFRLHVNGGTAPEPTYGGQFAPRAILGVAPEGRVVITYTERGGTYADGQSYSLRVPTYAFEDLRYGPMSASVEVSPRIAQQLVGLGLIESVDITSLQAIAAHQATEGVQGRMDIALKGGRFGWKASKPTVREQTAAAFVGDIGITSALHTTDDRTSPQRKLMGPVVDGGDPELDDATLTAVAFYTQMLAVPARRNVHDPTVQQGENIFTSTGCASCHATSLRTASNAVHPSYANVRFSPYSDLMLHDMGADLADGGPDGDATAREWRTPPLWGIGLIPTVNGHEFLLHDGRARSIEEAILWHGGQAATSREKFIALSRLERVALITFLRSL